jgi:flagellar protein FliT
MTTDNTSNTTSASNSDRPGDESDNILSYYAALECASAEMLQAARNGDWDSVCRLEGACAVVVARLRQIALQKPLREREQGTRLRILRAILANDAEIRRICEPLPAMLDPRSFVVGDVSATLH